MIRPVRFEYNAQTAVNNSFQQRNLVKNGVNLRAQQEFDHFVVQLRKHGIETFVSEDSEEPHTPDSIFPNNWVSFHEDGRIILYPMFAENRRKERKPHFIDFLHEHFDIREIIDYSHFEQEKRFLEGTGSLVFDHVHKYAYACISPRTDLELAERICQDLGYEPILFEALDRNGAAIYHTNVMMCVADRYVVINMESIILSDRTKVADYIHKSGKEIIEINHTQMQHFAGNMLQVPNKEGLRHLVMSSQAWQSLHNEQQKSLLSFNPIIHSDLRTIEQNGGGSARCMMAEVYLKEKTT